MWRCQIGCFREHHHVIAPDLRGFGKSTTSESVSMMQMADDLSALLGKLEVTSPVVFCGLSMGGYVAWQFWKRHRDRLAALVLCDTRASNDSMEMAKARRLMADRVLHIGAGELAKDMPNKLFAAQTIEHQPSVVDYVRSTILGTPTLGIAAALRAMSERPDVTQWLPEIDVPALVICGVHDKITPTREMKAMASVLPNARFEIIENAGHMAPLEQPKAVNRVMAEFCSRLTES